MIYKIIKLANPGDDKHYIDDVQKQYNTICKSVKSTRILKRVGISGWQEGEDNVCSLPSGPLLRLLSGDPVYASSDNVLVICVDDNDHILGFLGGITNAITILDKYYDTNALSPYDRVKYISVYNHMSTKSNMDMAWIEILCVHPNARNIGVANRLIETFSAYVKETADIIGLDIVGTLNGGINLGLQRVYESYGFDFSMPSNKGDIFIMFNGAQFAGKLN